MLNWILRDTNNVWGPEREFSDTLLEWAAGARSFGQGNARSGSIINRISPRNRKSTTPVWVVTMLCLVFYNTLGWMLLKFQQQIFELLTVSYLNAVQWNIHATHFKRSYEIAWYLSATYNAIIPIEAWVRPDCFIMTDCCWESPPRYVPPTTRITRLCFCALSQYPQAKDHEATHDCILPHPYILIRKRLPSTLTLPRMWPTQFKQRS
jgi:hypothetical protein